MYQPPHFRMSDDAALLSFIEGHPLGLLISSGASGLIANPVPFFLRRSEEGEGACLVAHLAKANPQWQILAQGAEVLVVFSGANHYVSPGWYATKRETGKVVPAWNYQLVQVRGHARVHHDPEWLLAQVEQLTGQKEAHRQEAWAVNDAPEAFLAGQFKGIVGIEIEITSLEGKLKASQNRSPADREGVVSGLEREETPEAAAMLNLMQG
ncbi:FMN-binding negative transcriptional regulator [Allorhizobium undicola]|uniref:FMN-binding negative transcriptional regulator n=1 Tax=Allorhizobium undicola TaxID=78527 RepID=UPI003D349AE5